MVHRSGYMRYIKTYLYLLFYYLLCTTTVAASELTAMTSSHDQTMIKKAVSDSSKLVRVHFMPRCYNMQNLTII